MLQKDIGQEGISVKVTGDGAPGDLFDGSHTDWIWGTCISWHDECGALAAKRSVSAGLLDYPQTLRPMTGDQSVTSNINILPTTNDRHRKIGNRPLVPLLAWTPVCPVETNPANGSAHPGGILISLSDAAPGGRWLGDFRLGGPRRIH